MMLARATVLMVLALVALAPTEVFAQDSAPTLGLFAPNLQFRDGVERKAFVEEVARALGDTTGDAWVGEAYARRQDFDARLDAGALDLVIVDVDYFIGARGLEPLASGEMGGETARPMKLVVGGEGAESLSALRGARIVLPASARVMEGFLTGDVLFGEIAASDFFGSIDEVKDARAAMGAVELGRADATLVFADYARELRSVATSTPVPIAILALAPGGSLTDAQRSAAARAATKIRLSGAALSAFSSYDAAGVRAFKERRRRNAAREELVMQPAPRLKVSPDRVRLPDDRDALDASPVDDLMMMPEELR